MDEDTGNPRESITGCCIYTSDGPENGIGAEQSYDEVIKLIEEAIS